MARGVCLVCRHGTREHVTDVRCPRRIFQGILVAVSLACHLTTHPRAWCTKHAPTNKKINYILECYTFKYLAYPVNE